MNHYLPIVSSLQLAISFYWNDFKGVDVKGRVVLCLVNQPIVDKSFGGSEAPLTYYGRWTYKLEELRRLGAKGALIVHTDTSAGYGWSVVKSWGAAESVRLDPMSDEGTPLEGKVPGPRKAT